MSSYRLNHKKRKKFALLKKQTRQKIKSQLPNCEENVKFDRTVLDTTVG